MGKAIDLESENLSSNPISATWYLCEPGQAILLCWTGSVSSSVKWVGWSRWLLRSFLRSSQSMPLWTQTVPFLKEKAEQPLRLQRRHSLSWKCVACHDAVSTFYFQPQLIKNNNQKTVWCSDGGVTKLGASALSIQNSIKSKRDLQKGDMTFLFICHHFKCHEDRNVPIWRNHLESFLLERKRQK